MIKFKILIFITFIISSACSKDDYATENQQMANILWTSDWDASTTILRAFDLEKGISVDTIVFPCCCGVDNIIFNKLTKSLLFTLDGSLYNLNISSHEFEFLQNLGNLRRGELKLNLDNHNQILYGFDISDSKYSIIKYDLRSNKHEVLLKAFKTAGNGNYPPLSSALDEKGQKLYLALADSVYSFDIKSRRIEKAMKTGMILLLQFNPVFNTLNGISFDKAFKLTQLDIYHNYLNSKSFSRTVNVFSSYSALNDNTGEYILRTKWNEILVIDQDGNIKNSYSFDGETGLGVQTIN